MIRYVGHTGILVAAGLLWLFPPFVRAQTKGVQNVSLVREQSSPAVFLVVGDTKFWIEDSSEFSTLGFDWGMVRVVADGALARFAEGRLHAPPKIRPSDVFFDCPSHTAIEGEYLGNCKPSANIVHKDVLVAGWLSDDGSCPNRSEPTPCVNIYGDAPGIEDIHYDLRLDAVFLDRMYGSGGLSTLLSSAVWPGNPVSSAPIKFPTDPPSRSGGPNVASFNSWLLPCSGEPTEVHGELNAWHQNNVGSFWHRHWQGHGPPPAMWKSQLPEDSNSWFPFNPRDPTSSGQPLQKDDYVVMRGTIWQESSHSGCNWESGFFSDYDGITEIHPPDWIVRVRAPSVNALMTTAHVALTAGQSTDFSIKPPPIAGTQKILVRRAEDPVMDLRYSDTRSFLHVKTQPAQDHVDVHVDLCCPTDPRLQLRYKASWRVGWSEVSSFDWSWVDDQTPPGAALNREGEGWIWVSDNVFVGSSAHRSPLAGGLHQHSFTGASSPMVVQWQDTLFAMVYLDPDNPPDEVMLQWHTPNGWVQAFWGDDLIQPGSDGPPGRVNIGPLPPTGEWVRLDVKAQSLGISAPVNIDGMAFTLSGGQATWDYAGRNYANEVFQ